MADGHRAELQIALARVRRRWLTARWLHALARVAGAVCVGLLAIIGTDLFLAPPDAPMLATAGAALAAAIAFSARALWRLGRPPSDRRVARLVEERCPELEDRVASAAAVASTRPVTGFEELVVADAAERLRGIDPARVVTPARLNRAAVRGLLALTAVVAVVALGSTPLSRIARTAWLHASPSGASLAVEPGDFRLVAGQPFRVRARFEDGGAASTRTPPVLSVLDGATPRDIRMRPSGDGYLAEFPSVERSFRYRVGTAAFTSPDYAVEALTPPRVLRIDVEYIYPPHTGRAPRFEEDGGDLFAPAGASATLIVHTDKPVVDGGLVLSDGRQVALADAGDPRRRAATLVVEGDARYRVRVVDAHGLSNRYAADYLIRATVDRPPAVRVLRPGGDREVTPLEEVTIVVRADDDHAVERLDLIYTVVGRAERTLPFDVPDGASSVTGVRTFFVEDLSVEPGDVVTYFARVRDSGLGGVSTEARSDLYFLEIRPFDNEFEEALSQGGLGPQAAELGRLAGLQKQIVVATWRLDQTAGGSDDDVRAVAEVQGDVRDTTAGALGAAGRTFGRRRRGADSDPGAAAQRRALQAAVEAMTAAEAALEALDTASALPHETEALNQLLTAQAAVRRRQVSMQPGGGGGGRQAQLDLSQLFDRELRRDQETSYETGRQAGEPGGGEDDEDDEARDRLRELARRQERVNRDLREFPETGAAEERRRRLERLRREQRAIRAELEALAARLGGAADSEEGSAAGESAGDELGRGSEEMELAARGSGQGSEEMERAARDSGRDSEEGSAAGERGGDEPGRGSEEMERAASDLGRVSEEMRRAAGDLGRDDAVGARAHGDRAAEALRRLAERLRGERPGAGARAEPRDEAGERLAVELETARRLLERLQASAARDESDRPSDAGGGPRGEPSSARDGNDTSSAGERSDSDGSEGFPAGESSGDRRSSRDGGPRGEPSPASRGGSETSPAGDRSGGDGSETGRRAGRGDERAGSVPDSGQEAAAELAQHPGLLRALGESDPRLRADLERWARQWRSRSAPGADPAMLDLARWTSLRRDLVTALLQLERDRAQALAERTLRDRYSAAPDDAVSDRYRRLVDQYYRSLAGPRADP